MWRTASNKIEIEWSSVKTNSGIRGCDLDVSDDGGASWTHLLTETQATTYTFTGTLGVAYTFRVQATDNVSNASDWVQAEARTVVVKKYYSVAGQRIAMRANGVLYYLHTDHLGSTSLTTSETGAVVAEQRYLPYGEVRWVSGTLMTDLQFTGQRADEIGLLDYHARWYSDYLNRWIQPDSIIPDPANPQSLNRYSYVYNNALRYVDPTGHYTWEFDSEEAQKLFEASGWSKPEEFIDWLLSVLESAPSGGELEWFMPHFRAFDQEEGVHITFRVGGNIQGGKRGSFDNGGLVYLPAEGIITKDQAYDISSSDYTNKVLPYATIVAHEFYHATAQPLGYAPTVCGEQEAYAFQYQVGRELGLDWGPDFIVTQLAYNRSLVRSMGFNPFAEVRWALIVSFNAVGGAILRQDEHNMRYFYSPSIASFE